MSMCTNPSSSMLPQAVVPAFTSGTVCLPTEARVSHLVVSMLMWGISLVLIILVPVQASSPPTNGLMLPSLSIDRPELPDCLSTEAMQLPLPLDRLHPRQLYP